MLMFFKRDDPDDSGLHKLALVIMSALNLRCKIGGVALYKSSLVALAAQSASWPLQELHERENTRRAKNISFYFPRTDFTASFDSDKVLSAGDIGYDLLTLNTTISEDLSNKSAKSTHSRHFLPHFFFLSLFGDYFQWVETQAQEVLRISNSREKLGCVASRWQSILFAFPCFVSSLDVKLIRGACSGLYFGNAATMDPCLFPETIFFPVLSRIFLKSQAIRIRSEGLYPPPSNTSASLISNINILFS